MSRKLCILFPGVGYTTERPLMYYSGKVFKKMGYEVIALKYKNLPKKKGTDSSKMGETFKMVMEQTREQLADVFAKFRSEECSAEENVAVKNDFDSVVFVGKSIGTIASVFYASELVEKKVITEPENFLRFVYLTPLEETFKKVVSVPAIAFHGTADPWVETSIIERECERFDVPLYIYKDANHSLETGNVEIDIESVGDVMLKIEQFIK